MSIRVYLLLGETPQASLTWLRTDASGQLLTHGNAHSFDRFVLDGPDIDYAQDRLIALLPGEVTALRLLAGPPKGRGQFLSAARYLLEDSLAEDIDQLHVATSMRTTDGAPTGLCLAVSKTILDPWHEAFTRHQIFPALLSADFLALPLPQTDAGDGGVSIFVHRDGFLANGSAGGLAMDMATAHEVIGDIIEQWAPDHIDLYAEQTMPGINDLEQLTHHREADLATLAGLMHKATSALKSLPNLLTGAYGRKLDWRAHMRPWRGVMIAASLCLAGVFAGVIFDGMRAGRSADRFEDVASKIHHSAFPDAGAADPVRHARQVLGAREGAMGFLTLWLGFADAIATMEGVQIDAIVFAGAGANMRVTVNVDSLASLNAFKEALNQRGISAEERRMNQNRNGQYAGELTVRL